MDTTSLSIDEVQTLSLMLSESGAINRIGDGSEPDKVLPQLCMGHTEDNLFEDALALFEEEWLDMCGRYQFPNPQGKACKLTIILEGEEEMGVEFNYGSLSDGPPEDIIDWVEQVVHLTDDWWEGQLTKKQRRK